jgi:cytochrome P450
MDTTWTVFMMQSGQVHLTQRKMIRNGIGPQRVGSYDFVIEAEAAKLMMELQTYEGDPNLTIRQYVPFSFSISSAFSYQHWNEMICVDCH